MAAAGPVWADDRLSLKPEALALAIRSDRPYNPTQWRRNDESAWDFRVPENYLAAAAADAPSTFEQVGENPLGESRGRIRLNHRLSPGLNLFVAMAPLQRQRPASGVAQSNRPLLGTSSAVPTAPTAASSIDRPDMALSLGVDWWIEQSQGLRIGYLYGANPLEGIEGDPEAMDSRKQSLDLAYRYYIDGVYFSLGYVYTFSPLLEDAGVDRSANLLDDSAVYLRFQLKF